MWGDGSRGEACPQVAAASQLNRNHSQWRIINMSQHVTSRRGWG